MTPPSTTLPSGTWGGEQVALDVGPEAAVLRLGCARGELRGPIGLDANGRFSAQGELTQFAGGPATPADRSHKADYQGVVDGERLTLTVRHGTSSETYQLTRGLRSKVIGCL